jgi:hypothetical protein
MKAILFFVDLAGISSGRGLDICGSQAAKTFLCLDAEPQRRKA